MKKPQRRTLIKKGLIGGAIVLLSDVLYAKEPTPKEVKGPFYPIEAQKDKDFDLTRISGRNGVALGQPVYIEGRVLDTENMPIENATVDIWQANAAGRYRHPHDMNDAPLDPNFQGWAIVQSGKNGAFRFKTIIPGAYPVSDKWSRPPHIHFKVTKIGYVEIVTQMYFPDQKLNAHDLLLNHKSKKQQELMIASKDKGRSNVLQYNIVLKKV